MCNNFLSKFTYALLFTYPPAPPIWEHIMGSAYKTHLNALKRLQKRAIRIISQSSYNAPTSKLFKKLHIMKLDDIHNSQLAKLMHGVTYFTLPNALKLKLRINIDIHDHNTRQQNDVHIPLYKTYTVFLSLLHKGPELWCNLPQIVKSAPSYASFASRLTKHLLNLY